VPADDRFRITVSKTSNQRAQRRRRSPRTSRPLPPPAEQTAGPHPRNKSSGRSIVRSRLTVVENGNTFAEKRFFFCEEQALAATVLSRDPPIRGAGQCEGDMRVAGEATVIGPLCFPARGKGPVTA
jgi:hypothetical protein